MDFKRNAKIAKIEQKIKIAQEIKIEKNKNRKKN
jgi:hypothetical protein